MLTVLIDNGHGGMIDGIYQTQGKRSPKWDGMDQLFEGEFNRKVAWMLHEKLAYYKIPSVMITPEEKDISLTERCSRANYIAKQDPSKFLFVSIHANAFYDQSVSGWECFIYPGSKVSEKAGKCFYQAAENIFPDQMRPGPNKYKETDYFVLRKTIMPAVLTENFFMTNKDDCYFISTDMGRNMIADLHVNAIKMYMK